MRKLSSPSFSRRFLLDVSAAIAVFVCERGAKMAHKGLLPVFSTKTRKDAESLVRGYCRLARSAWRST